ncbi:carbohydrate kinase family protein [Microbacterium thalassium]|uniref:Sugar/nucleoside kinase (Ribokinase family) n=1 Tax=Microbacterium thalassium TaxID=362649 RepID=A0A7X0FQG9_9MICO|nr:PfkB family carbohydrate kinase [Microbacterium thalassium]MBB6391828.1 sugar/nucleoside kinase (ribokinase family) [Microbacterium thalassium]GLK23847.1 sugar kinase [Microbacterium thalassium]
MIVVLGDLIADVVALGVGELESGTDNTAQVALTRGGSAANVAAAVAADGVPARFIGRVGDDVLGRTLTEELARTGVDVRVQRAGRTGAIVIVVDEQGERTMITDRGAAAELEDVDPVWLDGARWLHVPLYGMSTPVSWRAIAAAVAALPDGVPVSVDLSSVTTLRALGPSRVAEALKALRPAAVFANADEASWVEVEGLRVDGTFVVKRGADPVLVHSKGRVEAVPVPPVAGIVDTTGAGDAFAAGYIAAAADSAGPPEAARAGAERARSALVRAGAL